MSGWNLSIPVGVVSLNIAAEALHADESSAAPVARSIHTKHCRHSAMACKPLLVSARSASRPSGSVIDKNARLLRSRHPSFRAK